MEYFLKNNYDATMFVIGIATIAFVILAFYAICLWIICCKPENEFPKNHLSSVRTEE